MHTHCGESAPFRLPYPYEEIHEESVVLIVCVMVSHLAIKRSRSQKENLNWQ